MRAEELREILEAKGKDAGLPFDTIVSCNIGNPQQLDQKPLTFLRQVRSTSQSLSSVGRKPEDGAGGSGARNREAKVREGALSCPLSGTSAFRGHEQTRSEYPILTPTSSFTDRRSH